MESCPGLDLAMKSFEFAFFIDGLSPYRSEPENGGVERDELLPFVIALTSVGLEIFDNKFGCSPLLIDPFFKFLANSDVLLLLFCFDNSFNWLIL